MKKILLLTGTLAFLSLGVYAQAKKKTTTPTKKAVTTTTPKAAVAAPVPTTPAPEAKPKKPRKAKQDGYVYAKDSIIIEPTPYPVIKKEDIIYTKRIWREVDFRDKGNIVLASPKVNLLSVIYTAVSNGELEMYGPLDESFEEEPVSSEKINKSSKSMADSAFIGTNRNTNELNSVSNEFFAQSFKGIRIKEDWIFDGKRGVFEPRIVGIAPIRLDIRQSVNTDGSPIVDANGKQMPPDIREQPVGWIYFDDLRQVLANTKIANDGNDKSGITFDDIFTKRLFFSYITKESSSADMRIQDLEINGRPLSDKEKLIEGERIKKKIADFEQSLWAY